MRARVRCTAVGSIVFDFDRKTQNAQWMRVKVYGFPMLFYSPPDRYIDRYNSMRLDCPPLCEISE